MKESERFIIDSNTGEGPSFDEAVKQALLRRFDAGYHRSRAVVSHHVVELRSDTPGSVWHMVQLKSK
jgi:hypothetical protein